MIYLAAPYFKRKDKEATMRLINEETAKLLLAGFAVYSPLTIGHYAGVEEPLIYSKDDKHWADIEYQAMKGCTILFVMCLKGWKKSNGIEREIETAKHFSIPIVYIKVEEDV